MIIGGHKDQVIANIEKNANTGKLNEKVEVDDPNITDETLHQCVNTYLENQNKLSYWVKKLIARLILDVGDRVLNKDTQFTGLENMQGLEGVVVTSNHFNPIDNTAVRSALRKGGKKRLYMISQATNLAMGGWVGYLMRYCDIIPVGSSRAYMLGPFKKLLSDKLRKGHPVLIYPEQEMWFNYRKPRPPKRGAYGFAAENHVPVLPLFVEIRDMDEAETDQFMKTRYVVHVLPPIYPDPEKSARQNSIEMMKKDYDLKTAAYEKAYGKKLDYKFQDDDIAGWRGTSDD